MRATPGCPGSEQHGGLGTAEESGQSGDVGVFHCLPEHCRGYGAAEGQFGLLVLGPCCAIIGSAGCRWLLGSAWLKEAGPYVNHRLLSFLPAAAVQVAEVAASTGFDKIRVLSAAVRFNSVVMKSVPGEAEEEVSERP